MQITNTANIFEIVSLSVYKFLKIYTLRKKDKEIIPVEAFGGEWKEENESDENQHDGYARYVKFEQRIGLT